MCVPCNGHDLHQDESLRGPTSVVRSSPLVYGVISMTGRERERERERISKEGEAKKPALLLYAGG